MGGRGRGAGALAKEAVASLDGGPRVSVVTAAAVAEECLPRSNLRQILQDYEADLRRRLRDEIRAVQAVTPFLTAELKAVERMKFFLADTDFRSCSNSPFFGTAATCGDRLARVRYALDTLYTIQQPVYSRHVKVIILLLCGLRCGVLARDVSRHAEKSEEQPAVGRMRGATLAERTEEQQALVRAFAALANVRVRSAQQMQSRRNALGKGKTSSYAALLQKAFADAARETANAVRVRELLEESARLSGVTARWLAAGHDVAAAVATFSDAVYWRELVSTQLKGLNAAEAAYSDMVSGTEVQSRCQRLRTALAKLSAGEEDGEARMAAPTSLDWDRTLTFLLAPDPCAALRAALAHFFDVVGRLPERAPELWALNYVLRWYGVEEALTLAHSIEVVDGGFKRLIGSEFEATYVTQESKDVVTHVLVPHCCHTTGCDEATAREWVEACLLCDPVAPNDATAGTPVWSGPSLSPPPPAYRLVRNVKYIPGDRDAGKPNGATGELDGVVFDAASRQVLFVLEAKHNMADLGKAQRQKERLYNALDASWKSEKAAQAPPPPPPPPPPPQQQSEKPGKPKQPPATAAVAKTVDVLFFLPGKTSPSSPETAFFTQRNFAAHFGAPVATPACAPSAAAPLVGGGGPSSCAAPVGREERWVYLTLLTPRGVSSARDTIPSPGGAAQLIESALVEVVCDSVLTCYDRLCKTGAGPAWATPALTSLFSSMQACSAFAPQEEPTPILQLPLELPPENSIEPGKHPQAARIARANQYAYAIDLYRHNTSCSDGTAALRHVCLSADFITGLALSDNALLFAMNGVAKNYARWSGGTPSFAEVFKSLVQRGCLRNLVMVVSDASTAPL
ncbi:hypothetical protein NESM_000143800 [Novymonas esmeraldas]|uniref:Uncharacterized protein n=1 Tax=Novymonas esmeraldas TaxID=1808958 RepID=A0AAW0F6T0_9TRYP